MISCAYEILKWSLEIDLCNALWSTQPGRESLRPAAIAGAVEDVEADPADLVHGAAPVRAHIGRVVMRGIADFLEIDLAGGDGERDVLGDLELRLVAYAVRNTVAGEGELAAIAPVFILIDDAA